jgi:hypothetical protein
MTRSLPVLVLLLCTIAPAAADDADGIVSSITASAMPTYSLDPPPRPVRLDFDFRTNDTTAWLVEEGDFQVQGWIKHDGLLCGTYQLGVRFGMGAPGCLNVNWLGEPQFVTSEVQCNGARVQHMGGDDWDEAGTALKGITCAERVVRCTGSCN